MIEPGGEIAAVVYADVPGIIVAFEDRISQGDDTVIAEVNNIKTCKDVMEEAKSKGFFIGAMDGGSRFY